MPRIKKTHFFLLIATIISILYTRGSSPRKAVMSSPSGKPWADGPLPLVKTPVVETGKSDTWNVGASHMALLHNSILRGYNTIYLQAPHVQVSDYSDFINYAQTWYKFIKAHHDAEEEDLFPKCLTILNKEDKEIWAKTHEEHEAMLPPLHVFYKYLTSLKGKEAAFDAAHLLRLMEDIKEPLVLHLHSEIAVIARLSQYGSFPAAEPALDAWGQRSVTGAGLLDVVPFMFLNHDRTYEGGHWKNWPPMPLPVRFVVVKGSSWWRKGWWRFASCDGNGVPRQLYAGGA